MQPDEGKVEWFKYDCWLPDQHAVLKKDETVRDVPDGFDELFTAEARINDLCWPWQKRGATMSMLAEGPKLQESKP